MPITNRYFDWGLEDLSAGRLLAVFILMLSYMLLKTAWLDSYPTVFYLHATMILIMLLSGWWFGISVTIVIWVSAVGTETLFYTNFEDPFREYLATVVSKSFPALITGCITGLARNLNQKYEQVNRKLKKETKHREQSDLLLKEMNHRTKNNLALITGFLDLHLFKNGDNEVAEIIKSCKTRVLSLAELHNILYQRSSGSSNVNMRDYIERLVFKIEETFAGDRDITISQHIDDVSMKADKALSYCLIVNELLTNAIKHAFHNSTCGHIELEIRSGDGQIQVRVEDNGCGLPDNFGEKIYSEDAAAGMLIIRSMVEQLDAVLEIKNTGGACFIITGTFQ